MVHLVLYYFTRTICPASFVHGGRFFSLSHFYHFSFYLSFFNRNGGIHPRSTKQFRPELAQKVTDLTCARPRFFSHSIFGYAESEPPRPQSSDPTSKFGNHPHRARPLHNIIGLGSGRLRWVQRCTEAARVRTEGAGGEIWHHGG